MPLQTMAPAQNGAAGMDKRPMLEKRASTAQILRETLRSVGSRARFDLQTLLITQPTVTDEMGDAANDDEPGDVTDIITDVARRASADDSASGKAPASAAVASAKQTQVTRSGSRSSTSGDKATEDSNIALSVADILETFDCPMSEREIWAICRECVLSLLATEKDRLRHLHITPETVQLNFKGEVQFVVETAYSKSDIIYMAPEIKEKGTTATTALEFDEPMHVYALGATLWSAADFGLPEEQEPILSEELEELIAIMTHDSPEDRITAAQILQACDDNILSGSASRDLCAQIVRDAHHMGTVMDSKLATSQADLEEEDLATKIRMWRKLSNELVKSKPQLRKVEPNVRPVVRQRSLCQFEQLLESIRSSPVLRKVHLTTHRLPGADGPYYDSSIDRITTLLDSLAGNETMETRNFEEEVRNLEAMDKEEFGSLARFPSLNSLDQKLKESATEGAASIAEELKGMRVQLQDLKAVHMRVRKKLKQTILQAAEQQQFYIGELNRVRAIALEMRAAAQKNWSSDGEKATLYRELELAKVNEEKATRILEVERSRFQKQIAVLMNEVQTHQTAKENAIMHLKDFKIRGEQKTLLIMERIRELERSLAELQKERDAARDAARKQTQKEVPTSVPSTLNSIAPPSVPLASVSPTIPSQAERASLATSPAPLAQSIALQHSPSPPHRPSSPVLTMSGTSSVNGSLSNSFNNGEQMSSTTTETMVTMRQKLEDYQAKLRAERHQRNEFKRQLKAALMKQHEEQRRKMEELEGALRRTSAERDQYRTLYENLVAELDKAKRSHSARIEQQSSI